MPAPAPRSVRRLTALVVGRVGDFVVATPMLRALRQRYPEASLRLVAGSAGREAAAMVEGPWEVKILERLPRLPSDLALAARLWADPGDLLVDLNPAFSKSAAVLAAVCRAPCKVSFKRGRWDRLFNLQAEAAGEREHMLDRYARLSELLGAPYEPRMELRLPKEADRRADEVLVRAGAGGARPGRPRVLVHPGNFKKFDNRWPEEKFAQLTDRLVEETGASVVYLTGPGEEEQVRALVSRLKKPVAVAGPADLGATGALMRRMDLCVLNVTGTTHLAAALDVPTFCFYSGYTDTVWRPRGPRHAGAVSSSWTSCRDIPVEQAYDGLRAALAARRAGGG